MKFSEERELFTSAQINPGARPLPAPDRPSLHDYLRIAAGNRQLIFLIMALALTLGTALAVAMRPVYEANLLIQIADAAGPTKSLFGDAGNLFDIKTPATAEMEIMRSRMIVGPAAEKNQLLIVARPHRWSVRGMWRAALASWQSRSAPSGAGPDAGGETIAVAQFDVPAAWQDEAFLIRNEGGGRYTLRHPSIAAPVSGKVGETIVASLGKERLSLNVSRLDGDVGSEFTVLRRPRGEAIERLQESLKIAERGRQSGIIEATFRDTDPLRAAAVLNTIGANYIRQNLDRQTAEAEKSLAFLDTQLPALKQQVEQAESAYNSYRSRMGTVSVHDETKIALERSSELKGKLLEAQQTRRDLLPGFGPGHPRMKTLDAQIHALESEIGGLQGKIRQLPGTEQNSLKLERDLKVSSDLYQQLRNSALQLQLVREGRAGNARIIDAAVAADKPVQPKPALILAGSVVAGALASLLAVLIRSGLARGVTSVREIEASTGLNVYATTIPLSKAQHQASRRESGQKLLALSAPGDPAVESLRQLRTVLQNQMRDRKNNRLMITGARAGVGVQFMAANLAAVMASAGKRVLLVDADLRRGSLNRFFDAKGAPGLAELVAGTCARKQAVRPTAIAQLDFMPAGYAPSNPGDLVAAPAFLEALDQSSKEYDIVLLSAPPLLDAPETLSMASAAATVVLVTRARRTPVTEIAESARRLSQAGQFANGVVLNGV